MAKGGAKSRGHRRSAKAKPAVGPPVRKQSAGRRFQRLLLVEDDDLVAIGLTVLLEMEGIAVQVVSRGLLVVKAVESFEPEAVILDLTLPDIGGVEVFRRLRKRWPQLPVVFSTGHGDEVELAAELNSDRVALLRKPYEIGDLLSALQRIVVV